MKSVFGGFAILWLFATLAYANESSSSTTTSPSKVYQMFNWTDFKIPHQIRLQNPLTFGSVVQFNGVAKADAYRINANFQHSDGKMTIPIHLSTRFTEGFMFYRMVFNNLRNGRWNDTEIRENTAFWHGKDYDLRVRFNNATHFTVYGNRKKVGVFELREDLSTIDHIAIDGDVILNGFRINSGFDKVNEPQMFTAKFTEGSILRISGQPTGEEFKFRLEKSGETEHIPFELKFSCRQSYIGRNNWINGNWSVEDRTGGFPIKCDELVDVALVHEKSNGNIQIYVNDQKFVDYQKRFNEPTDLLRVQGDFELHSASVSPAVVIGKHQH